MSNWTKCNKCGMALREEEICPMCERTEDITVEEFAGLLQKKFSIFMNDLLQKKGKPGYRSMSVKNWCRLLGEYL